MSIRPILALLAALAFSTEASRKPTTLALSPTRSRRALVKTLLGFNSSFATVNGIRLHYVAGGEATRCFCFRVGPRRGGAIKDYARARERHRVDLDPI